MNLGFIYSNMMFDDTEYVVHMIFDELLLTFWHIGKERQYNFLMFSSVYMIW